MLEKIGLPAKPSLRGSNWVADASHCQGCSSPFTFINRKHHCRRCGGIYCSSCTQQRMVLRGQGDSPVRICEPCKNLEEAARFELRHGHTSRSVRGSSRSMSKQEDEILNKNDAMSSMQRSTSGASCSNAEAEAVNDERAIAGSHSTDENVSPEELRQKASDEKKMYRILKGRGKSAEALKAFKRGKELERQADALELNLRKTRKKASPPGKLLVVQNENGLKEAVGKNKVEKDDLSSELRELGWSDLDIREDDKKPANMSLEGELISLLGEASQNTSKSKGSVDTTQVVAHKRKALTLKREGKLAEAKEELKKAKLIEKQIEEQALLAEAEDSDDELSALIRSMDSDKQDDLSIGYGQKNQLDFNHLLVSGDDLGIDNNFEVTDKDMEDPEIAAALESFGWNEDDNHPEPVAFDREAVLGEILSLKKEALSNKRAGNVAEAMEHLRKAKALERDLESFGSQENKASSAPETLLKSVEVDDENVNVSNNANTKDAPKSRLMIQKELLGLNKKALALRREGKSDEAEEELKKGKVLKLQLDEIDNATKVNAKQMSFNTRDISANFPVGGREDDVTDQDMQDPTYLSLLSNLGWKEEDSDNVRFPSQPSQENNQTQPSRRRSKSEMQRELLSLKRKALALKRQGEFEEAEEVLSKAKVIEAEMEDMEAPKPEVQLHSESPIRSSLEEEDKVDVTEEDMNDPILLSVLNNMGWQHKTVTMQSEPSEQISYNSVSSINPSSSISVEAPRSKGEIQRELLALKRKALMLRRKGESEEAEELLRTSKALESQIEEMEAPKQVLLDGSSHDKPVSLGTMGSIGSIASRHPPSGSMPITDLLTGKDWIRASPSAEDKVSIKKIDEKVEADEKPLISEVNSNNQSPLRYEILTHKRKAVALKREGKLAEAMEELRQAKLLEKNLDEDNSTSVSGSYVTSVSTSAVASVGLKEQVPPISLPKPLSGRDRFKLQQQSLSHKRQAMKLRREGRMEEAEAEFELAKTLENQLEQSQDSTKSSGAVDGVVVEDLLDPELLSALNAIGMGDATAVSEKPMPAKLNAVKSENSNQERIQLEGRIKAEKVKAVNLKRSGKQAEALDALRRAKQLEKKVNALA